MSYLGKESTQVGLGTIGSQGLAVKDKAKGSLRPKWDFGPKMVDLVPQMVGFVLKMVDFTPKLVDWIPKMVGFVAQNGEFVPKWCIFAPKSLI